MSHYNPSGELAKWQPHKRNGQFAKGKPRKPGARRRASSARSRAARPLSARQAHEMLAQIARGRARKRGPSGKNVWANPRRAPAKRRASSTRRSASTMAHWNAAYDNVGSMYGGMDNPRRATTARRKPRKAAKRRTTGTRRRVAGTTRRRTTSTTRRRTSTTRRRVTAAPRRRTSTTRKNPTRKNPTRKNTTRKSTARRAAPKRRRRANGQFLNPSSYGTIPPGYHRLTASEHAASRKHQRAEGRTGFITSPIAVSPSQMARMRAEYARATGSHKNPRRRVRRTTRSSMAWNNPVEITDWYENPRGTKRTAKRGTKRTAKRTAKRGKRAAPKTRRTTTRRAAPRRAAPKRRVAAKRPKSARKRAVALARPRDSHGHFLSAGAQGGGRVVLPRKFNAKVLRESYMTIPDHFGNARTTVYRARR